MTGQRDCPMRMRANPQTPDLFAQHASFLRRLARGLVADEHDREDLVQDTWTAIYAAGSEGPGPRNPRAWLARIVRNRAANQLRDRSRREHKERAPQPPAKDDALVGRELDVQERVLAAVKGLREPYARPNTFSSRVGVRATSS